MPARANTMDARDGMQRVPQGILHCQIREGQICSPLLWYCNIAIMFHEVMLVAKKFAE
jgi:hypothetical protein